MTSSTLARIVLILIALLNLAPSIVAFNPALTERFYGFAIDGSGLELTMRHRAVLLGMVGVAFAFAAFRSEWWPPALALGLVSKLSFLVLFALTRPHLPALSRVALSDLIALGALGLVAFLRR